MSDSKLNMNTGFKISGEYVLYNQIKSNIISPTVSEPVVTNYGCLENDFLMDSYCLCKPGSKLHSFHSIFVDPQFEDDRIFNLKSLVKVSAY